MPTDWLLRAAAAATAVTNGDDPDEHRDVWKELKDGLADLFFNKCWYCELPIPRSDNAVDHFRPKGRVSDAVNPHSGYRWLAFEQSNFRYACTFCNSRRKDVDGGTAGGKADRFPLQDETKRVYTPGPVTGEFPTLLDPCEIGDWRLLGCKKENGEPCPASTDPNEYKRAEVSIDIYHLQHEPTCKWRHTEAIRLLSEIEEAKGLFLASQTDSAKELDFKIVAKKILRAIDARSAFSGEMRFLLAGERHTQHPWIENLLTT
ncbi:MAG TPA: hypothetical protein VK171_03635 [Fimbriimonas sp.]|nr:hypothetical protein [Fimbriimonas sp.]